MEEAESSRMGKTAGNMWRDRERLDELGRIRGEEEEMNLRLSPSGSVAERKRDLSHERCHPYRDPPQIKTAPCTAFQGSGSLPHSRGS